MNFISILGFWYFSIQVKLKYFISHNLSHQTHDTNEYLTPLIMGFTPCIYKKLEGKINNEFFFNGTVSSFNINSPPEKSSFNKPTIDKTGMPLRLPSNNVLI